MAFLLNLESSKSVNHTLCDFDLAPGKFAYKKYVSVRNSNKLCSSNRKHPALNRPRREEALDTLIVELLSPPLSNIEPKNWTARTAAYGLATAPRWLHQKLLPLVHIPKGPSRHTYNPSIEHMPRAVAYYCTQSCFVT